MKKFVEATIIIKRILDLRINLIIDKLLAFALVVEKHFTKTIFKNKAIKFCINTLSPAKALEAANPYFWYSIRSPKAKIWLEDSSRVTVFLDTDAEINVITNKLIKDANLAIK